MEAFVQSDVARNLIECLGVRIVKMTSVGKSFQELFAKVHVASALDVANTVLSAHFQWPVHDPDSPDPADSRDPGGDPDENRMWKAEIKILPDDGSFETAFEDAAIKIVPDHEIKILPVWKDGGYLLSELHSKTYAKALASNPLLAERLKVLCLMPTKQVFEWSRIARIGGVTEICTRCEAVVAGHRLGMEYGRCEAVVSRQSLRDTELRRRLDLEIRLLTSWGDRYPVVPRKTETERER